MTATEETKNNTESTSFAAKDGAELDFSNKLSYTDYLQLDNILSCQQPLTTAHDEMLFIVQHQTSELWMRLAIYELKVAVCAIREDRLRESFKILSRVARIFEQLNSAWDVLRTMTPHDYAKFRARFGKASGFQSYQYRAIEFLVGNKNEAMLKPHEHVPEYFNTLKEILEMPSIYDEALMLLSRKGFKIPKNYVERDWSKQYERNQEVEDAWSAVYASPHEHWELYELAEKLVDFEDFFRRWRFNHVTTVQRIIGFKRGSGGTSGVDYLQRMLSTVLFPELWDLRTNMKPTAEPVVPNESK